MYLARLRDWSLAAVAIAVLAAPALGETLKFAHFMPPQHVITETTLQPFQAALEGSGLEIDIYPGGELGAGPREQYIRAVQGVADITFGLQGYTSSQFPRTMVSELPGVLPEGKTGYDVLWDVYEAGLLDAEFPGTVPLALWLSEPSIFIMRDKDIRTPADVEGLTIRVSGSAAAAVVEALGGTPVQMPAGEIYNSLQTGLIDGVITGASAVGDFRLDEVASSYTIGAPLGRISFYIVMNEARYNSLPDAERAALDEIAGRPLSKLAEDGWGGRSLTVLERLEASDDETVHYLSDEEIAAFAEVTLPVADAIVASAGAGDVFDAMRGND